MKDISIVSESLGDLVECLGRYLMLAQNSVAIDELRKAGEKKREFSAKELQIVRLLGARRDGVPFAQLAYEIDFGIPELSSRSTVSLAVNRLWSTFKRRYVEKVYNPENQRQPFISLTPDGKKFAQTMRAKEADVLREFVEKSGLTEAKVDIGMTRLIEKYGDPTKASPPRIYDLLLGGTHNLFIDRFAVDKLVDGSSVDLQAGALLNRKFLQRAARFVVNECNVRQIVDIGAGFPIREDLEITSGAAVDTVVRVDLDPAVVRAWTELKQPAVLGDVRDVNKLAIELKAKGIDFSRPVTLVLGAVLHFISDGDGVSTLVQSWRRRLCSGSSMIFSHAMPRGKVGESSRKVYSAITGTSVRRRSEADLLGIFKGMDLIGESQIKTASDWMLKEPVSVNSKTPQLFVGIVGER